MMLASQHSTVYRADVTGVINDKAQFNGALRMQFAHRMFCWEFHIINQKKKKKLINKLLAIFNTSEY
jgi:hypothetical protein